MRSAYRKQVERIAPPELIGRQGELRAMAGFCTDPGRGPYLWWRAPAWAGKSALMSWFVLHPPAGVDVVSFFITARLAAQDNRAAFTEVVIEQVAELTGQDLPALLTEATREAHLLDLLDQAAQASAERGRRLVLVVDGLDEDRGVTTGPDAHSIAALLPAQPAAGTRVIVAGRPSPPIPDDVPTRHPLKDPGIVRLLGPSPHAQMVRADAERDLQRLLDGNPAELEVLGLLVAAVGGLSVADLKQLAGPGQLAEVTAHDIRRTLRTVSGRTFASRASLWQPGTAPEVYVLAHEDLQVTATDILGPQRLTRYRDHLHTWAESYRARGWPAGTPEYLLRDYFRMLHATTDIPRLVACATDTARHDRMLDITGGDTAALNEITAALDLIAAQDDPDLTAALRLARHRDQLTDRNTHIPRGLPAVWATLGQPARAEALARSITDPYGQAEALAAVAGALAGAGQYERAGAVARSITDPYRQAEALAAVTGALAGAGQSSAPGPWPAPSPTRTGRRRRWRRWRGRWPRPETTSRPPRWRPRPRPWPAPSPTRTGRRRRWRRWRGRWPRPETPAGRRRGGPGRGRGPLHHRTRPSRGMTLGGRGRGAGPGRTRRASRRPWPGPSPWPAPSPTRAGRRRVGGGGGGAGRGRAVRAAPRPWPAPSPTRTPAGGGAGGGGGGAGRGRAVRARRDRGPLHHQPVLAGDGGGGDGDGAGRGRRSTSAPGPWPAPSPTRTGRRRRWRRWPGRWPRAGQYERAGAVARSITDPDGTGRRRRWRLVAGALAQAGQYERAEAVARSITDPYRQAEALAAVAGALARAGQYEQRRGGGPLHHRPVPAGGGAGGGGGGAGPGRRPPAGRRRGGQAGAVARSITDYRYDRGNAAWWPWRRRWLRQDTTSRLPPWRPRPWPPRPRPRPWSASPTRTCRRRRWWPWPRRWLRPDSTSKPPPRRPGPRCWPAPSPTRTGRRRLLAAVAGALAQAGHHEQAEAVARSITDPDQQAEALAAVAEALARAGRHRRAAAVAGRAQTAARRSLIGDARTWHSRSPSWIRWCWRLAMVLTAVAGALAQAGCYQRVATIAFQAVTARRQQGPCERERRVAMAPASAAVAQALAQACHHRQATKVAARAGQADGVGLVATTLAQAKDCQQAAAGRPAPRLARSIDDPGQQAEALAAVAVALAQAGPYGHAARPWPAPSPAWASKRRRWRRRWPRPASTSRRRRWPAPLTTRASRRRRWRRWRGRWPGPARAGADAGPLH